MHTTESDDASRAIPRGVAIAPRALLLGGTVTLLGTACVVSPPDPCAGCMPLVSQTVMVARWRHEELTSTGLVVGIDLDGRVSDGTGPECTDDSDFVSSRTGDGGIDNQYAAYLLRTIYDGGAALSWGCGGAGWLSPPCPPDVPVRDPHGLHVLESQLAAGIGLLGLEVVVEPAPLDGTTESRVFVTLLELTAVSALRVETDRLAPGARAVPSRVETVDGLVTGRSLRATFSRIAVPLGSNAGLQPIEDATVLLSFDPTGHLVAGELGAAMTVETVIELFRLGGTTVDEATLRSIAHPDLDPDASGECQSFSFGVGLDVVPVELVEAP